MLCYVEQILIILSCVIIRDHNLLSERESLSLSDQEGLASTILSLQEHIILLCPLLHHNGIIKEGVSGLTNVSFE